MQVKTVNQIEWARMHEKFKARPISIDNEWMFPFDPSSNIDKQLFAYTNFGSARNPNYGESESIAADHN